MSREFVDRMRSRDPARKTLNLTEAQIDAQVAALKDYQPPLMRHEPQDRGGISRAQFFGMLEASATLTFGKPGT